MAEPQIKSGMSPNYFRMLSAPAIKPCPVCGTRTLLVETVYFMRRGLRGRMKGRVVSADPHRGPCSRLCVLSDPNDGDDVLHTHRDCPACAAYEDEL